MLGSNTGVSFGILVGAGLLSFVFSIVSLAIALALLVWLARTRDRLGATALGLLIGSALANDLDRVVPGAVTDFLDCMSPAGIGRPSTWRTSEWSAEAALLVLDNLLSGASPRHSGHQLDRAIRLMHVGRSGSNPLR